MTVVELSDAQLARLAEMVAERLQRPAGAASTPQRAASGPVTARELAEHLQVSERTVRRHRAELGGWQIGRLWRFDVEQATRAWRQTAGARDQSERSQPAATPASTRKPRRRKAPRTASDCPLLPVADRRARS